MSWTIGRDAPEEVGEFRRHCGGRRIGGGPRRALEGAAGSAPAALICDRIRTCRIRHCFRRRRRRSRLSGNGAHSERTVAVGAGAGSGGDDDQLCRLCWPGSDGASLCGPGPASRRHPLRACGSGFGQRGRFRRVYGGGGPLSHLRRSRRRRVRSGPNRRFRDGGFRGRTGGVGGGAAVSRARHVAALFGWSPPMVTTVGGGARRGRCVAFVRRAAPAAMAGEPHFAPERGFIGLQVLWTAVRLIGAAPALWVLLPRGLVRLHVLCPLFAAATALGALSHVPARRSACSNSSCCGRSAATRRPEAVAAALMAYRAIYFVLPLSLSAVDVRRFRTAFGARSLHAARRRQARSRRGAADADLHRLAGVRDRRRADRLRRDADLRLRGCRRSPATCRCGRWRCRASSAASSASPSCS